MKRVLCFCCLLLVCSILSVSIFAQTLMGVSNLQDLDKIIGDLGVQISVQLKNLSTAAKPSVSVGNFTYQNVMTNFGTVMNQNIITAISVNAENKYNIIPNVRTVPSSSSAVDYMISGEIVEIGNTFRVYTRIIRSTNNSIAYSWQTDFEKTMYLMNLVNVSGGGSLPMDVFEFDSIDNPVPINLGDESISRNLHSDDDEDWFSYTAEENSILLFLADGSDGIDTRMDIYNSNQSEIASNDDYEDLDAGIVTSLESGETIYIKIYGYDDDAGAYILRIQETRIDDESMEPNNSMEQASLVTPSANPIAGFFMSDGDPDWYKVVVSSSNKSLRIYTEGGADTYLRLYDDEGDELDTNDDGGDDYNARINHSVSAETYYIEVTDLNEDTGPYTLFINLQDAPQPDSYENDDSMSNAKEIVSDVSQTRTFSDSDDEDWVYFDVTRSRTYVITAVGESTSFDTYIELYDEDGEYLDEDDDGGDSLDARLRTQLDPGRYYILVTTLDDVDYPEPYTLRIED